ncbi:hypothetical protein [Kutzneria sp. NPDC052558]|uniref:hypothetical protein n=1 Tax=Kutzneria sp. NPDC052558 TaxID=3364121 RepID=UPI0037CADBC3
MTALVVGGGGPVGTSWTASLLHGLMTAGVPVADSSVVVAGLTDCREWALWCQVSGSRPS